jgi:hypothetical protein
MFLGEWLEVESPIACQALIWPNISAGLLIRWIMSIIMWSIAIGMLYLGLLGMLRFK